jgi:hypothetical protein
MVFHGGGAMLADVFREAPFRDAAARSGFAGGFLDKMMSTCRIFSKGVPP